MHPSSGSFTTKEYNFLFSKTPWGWHPGAETCRSLILVMSCILLSACVGWCINCKNMHGANNIKFFKAAVSQQDMAFKFCMHFFVFPSELHVQPVKTSKCNYPNTDHEVSWKRHEFATHVSKYFTVNLCSTPTLTDLNLGHKIISGVRGGVGGEVITKPKQSTIINSCEWKL